MIKDSIDKQRSAITNHSINGNRANTNRSINGKIDSRKTAVSMQEIKIGHREKAVFLLKTFGEI